MICLSKVGMFISGVLNEINTILKDLFEDKVGLLCIKCLEADVALLVRSW